MEHRAPNVGTRLSTQGTEGRGLQPYRRNNNMNLPVPTDCVSLAAYVAENSLVSQHWEERPLGLTNFICPSTGECQDQEVGVSG